MAIDLNRLSQRNTMENEILSHCNAIGRISTSQCNKILSHSDVENFLN